MSIDIQAMLARVAATDDTKAIFFTEDKIILDNKKQTLTLPLLSVIESLDLTINDYHLDGDHVIISSQIALDHSQYEAHGYKILKVKKILAEVTTDEQYQLLKNYHWVNWNQQAKYCGQCGKRLESKPQTPEKKCLRCDKLYFPRFSPAVMVLVYDDERVLLARSPHFPPGDYSAVAGFIDVGETAEQAAHREVKEELGVEIKDLEYFSTQTWPFPDSFMIAFKAHYKGGDLKIDPNEIEDARWFSRRDLPNFSPSGSIARKLISSVKLDINAA